MLCAFVHKLLRHRTPMPPSSLLINVIFVAHRTVRLRGCGDHTPQDHPQFRGVMRTEGCFKFLLRLAPFLSCSFKPRGACGGEAKAAGATVFTGSDRQQLVALKRPDSRGRALYGPSPVDFQFIDRERPEPLQACTEIEYCVVRRPAEAK